MEIQIHRTHNTTYVVIDSFFEPSEVEGIKKELLDIKRFASSPETTGTAIDDGKQYKKSGTGVFLDGLYSADRSKSEILTHFSKLFNKDFVNVLAKYDASFAHLLFSTKDNTLVNYYGHNDYYKPHKDVSILTAVCFFTFDNVSAGEFVLPDYDVKLDCVENRLILFHGCIEHGANPVAASKNGFRVSIAKFINYK
jgi:hypothetical protein